MKKINFLLIALLICSFVAAQTEVFMNVGTIQRQTLTGKGASITDGANNIPEAQRQIMSDMTFKDFKMNTLRLWKKSYNNMITEYVDSKVMRFAMEAGVTNYLLGPGSGINPPSNMTVYANDIANLIKQIKDNTGYQINVTGIANEPDNWIAANVGDAIIKIRAALDANGNSAVKIIAPESSNADDHWLGIVKDVKANNPTAWNKLDGIASHSYTMCANENWAQTAFSNNKEYWMSESSDNGIDSETNDGEGTVLAGRFVNDMNHGVNSWIYFIAYASDMNDNMTKLLTWDASKNKIFIPAKYYFMKHVYNSFDIGSKFRKVLANGVKEMDQTYNNKSPYNGAAAINPDGSWSLVAVNGTGIQGFAEQSYKFTFDVPELRNAGTLGFNVTRTHLGMNVVADGTASMVNGQLSIVVGKKEVVTLRSNSNIPPPLPIPTTSISLVPKTLSITTNSTEMLMVNYLPLESNDHGVNWSSSNTSVATVDAYGQVTSGVNTGTATITATLKAKSTIQATAEITVTKPVIAPSRLVVGKTTKSIVIDGLGNDDAWTSEPFNDIAIIFNGEAAGFTSPEDLTAKFKATHDATKLYFFFDIIDDVVTQDPSLHWAGDKVEIYMGLPGALPTGGAAATHGRQFAYKAIVDRTIVGQDGSDNYAGGTNLTTNGIEYGFVRTATGYTMEVSIEKAIALENVLDNAEFIFDICIADNDELGSAKRYRKSWRNDGKVGECWSNMTGAGKIVLSSDPTALKNTYAEISAFIAHNNLIINSNEIANVIVIDITGKSIINTNNSNTINIASLHSGVYTARIVKLNGEVSVYRFVK